LETILAVAFFPLLFAWKGLVKCSSLQIQRIVLKKYASISQ